MFSNMTMGYFPKHLLKKLHTWAKHTVSIVSTAADPDNGTALCQEAKVADELFLEV